MTYAFSHEIYIPTIRCKEKRGLPVRLLLELWIGNLGTLEYAVVLVGARR